MRIALVSRLPWRSTLGPVRWHRSISASWSGEEALSHYMTGTLGSTGKCRLTKFPFNISNYDSRTSALLYISHRQYGWHGGVSEKLKLQQFTFSHIHIQYITPVISHLIFHRRNSHPRTEPTACVFCCMVRDEEPTQALLRHSQRLDSMPSWQH